MIIQARNGRTIETTLVKSQSGELVFQLIIRSTTGHDTHAYMNRVQLVMLAKELNRNLEQMEQ